ncbi:hypothetical protein LguiB_007402 [Lonicera macranthoides]
MSSLYQSFMATKQGALPVSQSATSNEQGVRRRLSSFSLNNLQSISSPATSWAFRRSKSVSSMGEYAGSSVKKWWEWGLAWILSRKPTFASDLEMSQEETSILGSRNKGSWRHVFYKVRSELRRIVRSDKVGLPQTYRYDSYHYAQNFDDGSKRINSQGVLVH